MKNKIFSFLPLFIFIVIILIIIFSNNKCNQGNDDLYPNVKSNESDFGNELYREYEDSNKTQHRSFIGFMKKNKGIAMVLFYKDNCPFCDKFESNFEMLAKEFKNKVTFARINLSHDENSFLADDDQLDIDYVPSISIYKNNERVKIFENNPQQRELSYLRDELNKYL
ncbi:MAG: conjugal transfer protein TraF [Bacteroidetes bacterium]|nr:conjugal transfer protein TraF [Bacteroidota bacterium]